MTMKSFLDCERSKLEDLKNLQLSNAWKKIGIAIAIISFIAMFIATKGSDYRLVAKYGLLIGMLLISISKEEIEDELVTKLRMQSYTFAFIVGVFYAIATPFIDYLVDFAVQADQIALENLGDFNILWILLSVQVFYFQFLKRVMR